MEEQQVKERILGGAEQLFMQYGLRSISMDDIARHLSVSKKTLYQHFKDKDELIVEVLKGHLGLRQKEYESYQLSSVNAMDELACLSMCMRKDFEGVNPTLLYDLKKFHPMAWEVWQEFKNNFMRNSVVRNLRQGIEEGYFREGIDPETLAVLRIEMVQMAFHPDIFPREKTNLVDIQVQLFDHFVHGLLTDKGRKMYQKLKGQKTMDK